MTDSFFASFRVLRGSNTMHTPHIDSTRFGSITIDDIVYDHDVIVRLSGDIVKRNKKLSKHVTGSSHKVSDAEAEFALEAGCETVIVGSGQQGVLHLTNEALAVFEDQGCTVLVSPTPQAIQVFNRTPGPKVGLFHVTC